MEDFKAWYFQFPVVSRSFITAVVAVTLVSSVIYSQLPAYMYLDRQKIMDFQIWRLYSNFFFIGTFGPNIIWEFVYLYFATTRVDSLFTDRQVDEQMWLYFIVMTFLSIAGLIFKFPFLCSTFLFALIYIWCKRQPFETVQFFFGLKFKSGYFPFILMGFHLILGQSILQDLLGVAAGHGYVFFKYIYPVSSGKDFLRTPRFFTSFVNKFISKTQAHNYQNPNNQQQNNQGQQGFGFRHFQGQGVRIG